MQTGIWLVALSMLKNCAHAARGKNWTIEKVKLK